MDVEKNNVPYYWSDQYWETVKKITDNANYDIKNAEELKEQIIRKMLESQKEKAAEMMQASVCSNLVVIATQIIKLIYTWKEINDARVILANQEPKLQNINANFILMETKLNECADIQTRFSDLEDIPANEKQQKKLLRLLDRLYRDLTTRHNNTMLLVNDVNVNVNGKIEKLKIYEVSLILDGVSNSAMAVGNGIQLYQLSHLLSGPMFYTGLAVTVAFSALAVGNVITYHFTSERLNELREKSRQVQGLTLILKDNERTIGSIFEWINENDL